MTLHFEPMNQTMIDASLNTFARVSAAVSAVAIVVFTARMSLLVALVGSPSQYVAALKELIVFFVALALFGPIFKAVILTTGQISAKLAITEPIRAVGAIDRLGEYIRDEFPILSMAAELGPASLTYVAQAVYSILLGAVCAVVPLVFLFQLIAGGSGAMPILMGTVLTLSSWPIIWNAMGVLANQIAPSFSQTSLSGFCFWFVVKVLQLLSPLFSSMLVRSYSVAGAAKSVNAVRNIKRFAHNRQNSKSFDDRKDQRNRRRSQ